MSDKSLKELEPDCGYPFERVAGFFKSVSGNLRHCYGLALVGFVLTSFLLLAEHTYLYGLRRIQFILELLPGTPPAFFAHPAPFNSIIISNSIVLNYLFLLSFFVAVKGLTYLIITGLAGYRIMTVRKKEFTDIYAKCWLVSLSNIAIAIPYTGIWQAWVLESLLLIYVFHSCYNINMIRTSISIVICQLFITAIIGFATPIPIDFEAIYIAGISYFLPFYPNVILAIY
jgi:hypothetical protein